MGFGDLFSRKSREPQQPHKGEVALRHDEAAHMANDLALNAESRHPAWKTDCITSSTGGESMRISTVRQLSRVLGTILAEETRDSVEAKRLVDDIKRLEPTVPDYPTLLNMTVAAIVDADSFRESTPAVVHAWKDIAREHKVEKPVFVLGLVAVTRDSCTEMLRDLLSKPAHGDSLESMDGTIRTFFHANGNVKEINIKIMNGRFSRAFIAVLDEAQNKYNKQQGEPALPGEKPPLAKPELAQVSLTVDNSFRKPNELRFFQVTSADFIQAYLTGTFEYAAGAYADDVRRENNKKPF